MGGRLAVVGEGPRTSEGDFWREQRGSWPRPAFRLDHINAFAATMGDAYRGDARPAAGPCRQRPAARLSQEMGRLTLTILLRTLFGTDVGENARAGRSRPERDPAAHLANATGFADPPPRQLPDPRQPTVSSRPGDAGQGRLRADRRASSDGQGRQRSPLHAGVRPRTRNWRAMTDKQTRDDVMTCFIAGRGPRRTR